MTSPFVDDAVAREKLLTARGEIEEVLKRHNLAGYVMLYHPPGAIEVLMHLTPTWSKLTPIKREHGIAYHLRSKSTDYGGDIEAQRRMLEATVGMVSSMAQVLGTTGLTMLELATELDNATGAEHTGLQKVHKQ